MQNEGRQNTVSTWLLPRTSLGGFRLYFNLFCFRCLGFQVAFAPVLIYSILGGFCLCLNLFYSGWLVFLCQSLLYFGCPCVNVQFQEGYVLKLLCPSVLVSKILRTCACMFNSRGICAQNLMSSHGHGSTFIILMKNSLKGFTKHSRLPW